MRPYGGKVENNNWAELGDLVIKYWKGDLSRHDIEAHTRDTLAACGCIIPEKYQVEAIFDTDDKVHIVIPVNPWSVDDLVFVSKMESYRRELGIAIMGGCR